jgi:hypothetical protein
VFLTIDCDVAQQSLPQQDIQGGYVVLLVLGELGPVLGECAEAQVLEAPLGGKAALVTSKTSAPGTLSFKDDHGGSVMLKVQEHIPQSPSPSHLPSCQSVAALRSRVGGKKQESSSQWEHADWFEASWWVQPGRAAVSRLLVFCACACVYQPLVWEHQLLQCAVCA